MDLFEKPHGAEQWSSSPHAVGQTFTKAVWSTVTSYKVPKDSRGILRAWGFDAPAATHATLELKVQVNKVQIPDYPDGIKGILGGIRAEELEEVWVPVKPGDLVSLDAYHNAADNSTFSGRLKLLLWRA